MGTDRNIKQPCTVTFLNCGIQQAKENISNAQARQKKAFNLKRKKPDYKVGDNVLHYNRRRDTQMGDKLQPRFYGPFIVSEVLGRGVYRLMKENSEDVKQSVNTTNVKLWVDQVSPSSTPQKQLMPSKQTSPQKKHVRRMPTLSQRTMPVKQPTMSPRSPTTPVTVKSADDSTSTPSAWWVHDLHLIAEEHDIIEHGDWLNDKVVGTVNNLVAKHLQIPDCQSSVMAL